MHVANVIGQASTKRVCCLVNVFYYTCLVMLFNSGTPNLHLHVVENISIHSYYLDGLLPRIFASIAKDSCWHYTSGSEWRWMVELLTFFRGCQARIIIQGVPLTLGSERGPNCWLWLTIGSPEIFENNFSWRPGVERPSDEAIEQTGYLGSVEPSLSNLRRYRREATFHCGQEK